MTLISNVMKQLAQDGKKALIPYVTAGDPHPDHTLSVMNALVEAGADIIELGVPFSDPMADGPVIQLACERALAHNTSLTDVFRIVKSFREVNSHTPVVLMGYLNPIEVMGIESFAQQASEAGVNGVLVVDLPPEEAQTSIKVFKEKGLDTIFLLAPTTTDERIRQICDASSGYVYYVSVKGVTGSGSLDTDDVAQKVNKIKTMTDLPVGVGFGIHDVDSATRVAAVSDGIIIGSRIVRILEENQHSPDKIPAQLIEFLKPIRSALDEMESVNG